MINRDELLKMAWDCGFEFEADEIAMDKDVITRFSNAILERAAVEFEEEWLGEILYSSKASEIVRSLKTQGE